MRFNAKTVSGPKWSLGYKKVHGDVFVFQNVRSYTMGYTLEEKPY
jgi:hypothetical protein